MNVLRLGTRRDYVPSRVGFPRDGPTTFQKGKVLGFRNVAQHLEVFVSRLAFVARSDNLLADFRLASAETNRVIGL